MRIRKSFHRLIEAGASTDGGRGDLVKPAICPILEKALGWENYAPGAKPGQSWRNAYRN